MTVSTSVHCSGGVAVASYIKQDYYKLHLGGKSSFLTDAQLLDAIVYNVMQAIPWTLGSMTCLSTTPSSSSSYVTVRRCVYHIFEFMHALCVLAGLSICACMLRSKMCPCYSTNICFNQGSLETQAHDFHYLHHVSGSVNNVLLRCPHLKAC